MKANDAHEGTRISFVLDGEQLTGVVGRTTYQRKTWFVPITLDVPHQVWSHGPALREDHEVRPAQ